MKEILSINLSCYNKCGYEQNKLEHFVEGNLVGFFRLTCHFYLRRECIKKGYIK